MKDIEMEKPAPPNKTIIRPIDSVECDKDIMLHPVTSGEFAGKALRLPDNFYWYAGMDNDGQRVLVPTTRDIG
jgi:hypothetical protein